MGLDKLLYLQGVGAEFIDCFGRTIHITESDRNGILQTICADQVEKAQQIFTPAFIEQRNYELDAAPWKNGLQPFQWCYADDLSVGIYLPAELQTDICVSILTEQGKKIQIKVSQTDLTQVGDYRIGQDCYFHYKLLLVERLSDNQLASLLPGYHQVDVSFSSEDMPSAQGQWVITPRQAYQQDLHQQHYAQHKIWGLNIQLYALRSKSAWQIGDFGDLNDLINWVAQAGADFILLNPLHALNIAEPDNASPYSPCDRRRLNPLYIQLEKVSEYKLLATKPVSPIQRVRQSRQEADNWLDYPEIYLRKYQALIDLYRLFSEQHLQKNTARAKAYQRFLKQQGSHLQDFARREAANAPEKLAQPQDFYLYLQFLAEQQFAQCQENAKKRGMAIGLIRDLAVGAVSQGEEVQANAEQFCLRASVGAPPDPFAPQGQNWQLTPLDPVKLKQHSYQHFITLIRANMRHCGALRIDHIMALMRLWWWPKDESLGNGAYVYYPFEALLALLCLESHRARCLLVGEDLGVVPPEIVSKLHDAGIVSNELFYFCKNEAGFKPPEQYKKQSMMMLSNHDVPTLAAWWSGDDLHLRRELALFSSQQQLESALTERQEEKNQVIELLIQQELIASNTNMQQIEFNDLLKNLVTVVASGSARLFSIPLSDLMGDKHPVNIPGTWKEYPNWRRRHPLSIRQCTQNQDIAEVFAHIARQRPKNKGTEMHTSPEVGDDTSVTTKAKRHG